MKFRKATEKDVSIIVEMIADDELEKKRENFQIPLPSEYLKAFEKINSDENQELIVVENEDLEIIGTLQLSFIQYLTYRGGIRAQIEAVRIKKDKRGLGIGKIMFEWAINTSLPRTTAPIVAPGGSLIFLIARPTTLDDFSSPFATISMASAAPPRKL